VARIAVVDDNRDFVEILVDVLALDDHETLRFYQGAGTFRTLRDRPPDLVVLDIRMEQPESGWVLLDVLTIDPATRSIPVIVCSADVQQIKRRKDWIQEHSVSSLEKPFDLQVFLNLVNDRLAASDEQDSVAAD
jgi:DNA-binding NtrC family response regulator